MPGGGGSAPGAFPGYAAPSVASAVGDSAAAGTALTVLRSDMRLAREAFGVPGSSAPGDVAAGGASANIPRIDHVHGREAFGAVTAQTSYGASSSNGAAATDARSDHQHGTVPAITTSPRHASVYRNAALNAAGGTVFTRVAFDSEISDPNNNFDTATGLYTAPASGFYAVTSRVRIEANGDSGISFLIDIRLNGASVRRGTFVTTDAADSRPYTLLVSAVDLPVAAGDTIDIAVLTTAGTNRVITVGATECYADFRQVGS